MTTVTLTTPFRRSTGATVLDGLRARLADARARRRYAALYAAADPRVQAEFDAAARRAGL